MRKFTPSSRAMICASVVLPKPGGPWNNVWSIAWPRRRALSMKTARLARAARWPTNSSSVCGRSARSTSSGSGLGRRVGSGSAMGSSLRCEQAQRGADQRGRIEIGARRRFRDRRRCLALPVAEIDQRGQRIGLRLGSGERRSASPPRPGAASGDAKPSGTIAGRAPAAPIVITAGALARSSRITLCAIFGPTPAPRGSPPRRRATARGQPLRCRACPGSPAPPWRPRPGTDTSSRCHSRSARVGNPISCSRSSRTSRSV